MEFLKPHEKVKELRKMLKMKQHDLQDENITRGLISMIELGRRSITDETAKLLISKFRARANELGINIELDDKYFSRTLIEEAEYYCLKKLKSDLIKEEIEVVLDLAVRFDLNFVKAEGNKYLGDLYFFKKQYIDAFFRYIDALDFYNKVQYLSELAYVYSMLGACKSSVFEYLEALSYYNKAYYYSVSNNNKEIFKKSTYNIGRCYKKLNKYDNCIHYINEYLNLIDISAEFTYYAYAKILLANCYEGKKQFYKSIEIYNELISLCENNHDDIKGYVYNNLGELYMSLEKLDESLTYFNLAEKIRQFKDEYGLTYTYISKAEVYMKQGNYNEAIELILRSLNILEYSFDKELRIKAYYVLADIYSLINDKKNLKKVYLILTDLLMKHDNKNELIKLYVRRAFLSIEDKDIEMCEKYLKMIQNV